MPQIKHLKIILPSLVLALASVVAIPAFAEGDTGSGNTATPTSETRKTKDATVASTSDTKDTTTKTVALEGTANHEVELRKKGDNLLGEMKKDHKTAKTAEERQKACESHKDGLTTKFASIVKNSKAYQARIDGVLAKAEAYKTTNNLNPTNWDTLLAAATTAQATSALSIANLALVTPTLACNNVSVASDVATFKVAAQQVRTDLKAYKTAVHDLLKSLETAKDVKQGSSN